MIPSTLSEIFSVRRKGTNLPVCTLHYEAVGNRPLRCSRASLFHFILEGNVSRSGNTTPQKLFTSQPMKSGKPRRANNAVPNNCTLVTSTDSICDRHNESESRQKGVLEGTFVAASCLVNLMGLDQVIMKGLLDMLIEETVTVEVPSSGDDAEDKYIADCVKQALQMTSPSSRWWDATVRVTMSLPHFGTVERVANLSLAHCAAAVGNVELLHKCKDPHELLEMTCDTSTLHMAARFDHTFYVTKFAGMAITPFEFRVALSKCDKEKRSIVHYACSNGNTTFLHFVLEHLPYKNMVIPLLQMSDANGCTPTACAVVGNHVDVLRLLDDLHLFKEQTVPITVHGEDDKVFNVETSLAHLACEYGCTEVLEFLHEKKCQLDRPNSEGRTPAMVAAMFGKLKIIELLHSWCLSMETVPVIAIKYKQFGILQYLADSGVDISPKGHDMLKEKADVQLAGAGHVEVTGTQNNAVPSNCALQTSADSICGPYSESGQKGVLEGIFIATSYLVSLMGLDQVIMKGLLGMLTEETVTVEVPLTGDDAQDTYTSECVKQALQMTSPSSRWWDATVRVSMLALYFGAERRIANLSLAHCAAAVGSVELLHKCKDPHELLDMPCDATTMHLAACFDHIFYVSQFSGMAITPFELRVALSRCDKEKRSIVHYACSNGHTTFLHVVLEHLPYKNMVIPLLQMSDANGCTPTACAVVGNHVDVLRLLDSRHLFKDHTVHFIVHNEDDKVFNVETSLAHLACEYGCTAVLEFLHEKNCHLDRVNSEGRTPAMVATMFGKLKIIKLLLSWCISMETVPEMAIACMQCGILQYLADSGVDVTCIGRDMLKMEEVKREMDERGAKLAATQPPKQTVSAAVCRVVECWDGEYWVEAARKLLPAARKWKRNGDLAKALRTFGLVCEYVESAILPLERKLSESSTLSSGCVQCAVSCYCAAIDELHDSMKRAVVLPKLRSLMM